MMVLMDLFKPRPDCVHGTRDHIHVTCYNTGKPKDLEGICPCSDVTARCPSEFVCLDVSCHTGMKGAGGAEF